MFCPSWVNKFVITVAHALTVGPSGIIVCLLLWEHLGWLGVYLLQGGREKKTPTTTRTQNPRTISPKSSIWTPPKSNNGIPNGASFDTAVST